MNLLVPTLTSLQKLYSKLQKMWLEINAPISWVWVIGWEWVVLCYIFWRFVSKFHQRDGFPILEYEAFSKNSLKLVLNLFEVKYLSKLV